MMKKERKRGGDKGRYKRDGKKLTREDCLCHERTKKWDENRKDLKRGRRKKGPKEN